MHVKQREREREKGRETQTETDYTDASNGKDASNWKVRTRGLAGCPVPRWVFIM
jgi:hypothetical protein